MESTRLDKLLAFFNNEPNDEFLKYALATEYLKLKDVEKALFFFEDLTSNHPDYIGTYYHLGKLYETLNRKADAILVYQNGIKTAKKQNDRHALAELMTVYNEAAGIDDDEF